MPFEVAQPIDALRRSPVDRCCSAMQSRPMLFRYAKPADALRRYQCRKMLFRDAQPGDSLKRQPADRFLPGGVQPMRFGNVQPRRSSCRRSSQGICSSRRSKPTVLLAICLMRLSSASTSQVPCRLANRRRTPKTKVYRFVDPASGRLQAKRKSSAESMISRGRWPTPRACGLQANGAVDGKKFPDLEVGVRSEEAPTGSARARETVGLSRPAIVRRRARKTRKTRRTRKARKTRRTRKTRKTSEDSIRGRLAAAGTIDVNHESWAVARTMGSSSTRIDECGAISEVGRPTQVDRVDQLRRAWIRRRRDQPGGPGSSLMRRTTTRMSAAARLPRRRWTKSDLQDRRSTRYRRSRCDPRATGGPPPPSSIQGGLLGGLPISLSGVCCGCVRCV